MQLIVPLLSLALAGPSSDSACLQQENIVETAVAAGRFETLVAAVGAAGLADALQAEGPFTVFAPTDEAFAALPEGTVESLLRPENRGQLTTILTYHVVPGRLSAGDVLSRSSLTSLAGQRLPVSVGSVRVGDASIVQTDIGCSNGIIHVIDQVLIPQTGNLVQRAAELDGFGTLLKAAQAAGLAEALQGEGPLTVLAPTDEAFAAIPKDTLVALLRPENKQALASVLKLHVIPGRVYADQAIGAGAAATLGDESLRFSFQGGRLTVNGASVIANDVEASNGVIHAIDRVILPQAPLKLAPQGRLVIGVHTERPSRALAAQLGIDRHRSLMLSSIVSGSEAAKAGLQRYDVVVSINDQPASDKSLRAAKAQVGYGGKIDLVLFRGGKKVTSQVGVGREHG